MLQISTKTKLIGKIFVHDRGFYKNFFRLAGMLALHNIIIFSVNLADNLMLGAYSETALSGVALVNQIQYLLQMLVMGVGEGMIVLAAQYWGKKDTNSIRKVMSIGLKIGLIVGGFMFFITFFAPEAVLSILTSDSAVVGEGVKYLQIVCFSYIVFAVTQIFSASLRSVECVKTSLIISVSTLIINITLNSILIYGNLGFPEMGVRGAAIATLISRCVEVVIIISYIRFSDKKIGFRFKDFLKTDRILLKKYFKNGFPVLVSNTMWGIAMFFQTAIIGRLGGGAIAANSIATTIFQIVSVLGYGAASASAVIVGKTIGEGNISKVKDYARTMQILYLIIGIFTGCILFFLKDFIISFYSVSPQTKELAVQFITVLSITVVGTCYQVACLTGIVRGGGDTKFVLKNDTIFMWIIVLPAAFFSAFVFNFPPIIVFIVLKSDQILKSFVAFVKVNFGKWVIKIAK